MSVKPEIPQLKVGDILVVNDSDFRRPSTPAPIVSESRTHWHIIRYGDRVNIPKKPGDFSGTGLMRRIPSRMGSPIIVFLSSDAEKEYIWVERNRHKIREAIQQIKDCAKLKEIAALIGYKEEE